MNTAWTIVLIAGGVLAAVTIASLFIVIRALRLLKKA